MKHFIVEGFRFMLFWSNILLSCDYWTLFAFQCCFEIFHFVSGMKNEENGRTKRCHSLFTILLWFHICMFALPPINLFKMASICLKCIFRKKLVNIISKLAKEQSNKSHNDGNEVVCAVVNIAKHYLNGR